MEDIDGLVEVRTTLQKMQCKVDALTDRMKDLLPIERMLKMGQTTKLQVKMQKLREEEESYTKTLQPWQTWLSTIALKVTKKLSQARKMQTIVTSLLEEQPTTDLVNATIESVDQITQEIVELRMDFTKLNNEMWDTMHPLMANTGGSGTSHK